VPILTFFIAWIAQMYEVQRVCSLSLPRNMNCIFLKKKSKIESNLLREYDELKGVCT
jgi:hypothetical protein